MPKGTAPALPTAAALTAAPTATAAPPGPELDWRTSVTDGDHRGSEGTSLTRDGGKSWERVTDQGFHTLDCTPGGTCWGAGGEGVVGTLRG